MKNTTYMMLIGLLFTAIAYPMNKDQADKAAQEKQRALELEKKLMAQYKPTDKLCGAAIKEGGDHEVILNTELTCLLAGLKKILWIDPNQQKYLEKEHPDITVLRGLKDIKQASFSYFDPHMPDQTATFIFWYNPAAESNVELFRQYLSESFKTYESYNTTAMKKTSQEYQAKSEQLANLEEDLEDVEDNDELKENQDKQNKLRKEITALEKMLPRQRPINEYLQGVLLNYKPADIEYYYKSNGAAKELEADKRQAQDWLKKHKADSLIK